MAIRTIDFSTIPPLHSQKLLNLDYTYDNDRLLRKKAHHQYKKLKEQADAQFSNWFITSSSDVIRGINEFIEQSSKGDDYFPELNSKIIHITSLILGLHASDHEALLDEIADHVWKECNSCTILRIKPNIVKKDLVELIENNKGVRNLFVIVEQSEIMGENILRHLVHILHGLFLSGSTNRMVRILFCMSSNWNTIKSRLPLTSLDRLRVYSSIVYDTRITAKDLPTKLLLNEESPLQIGPRLTTYINYNFTEKDATYTNLKYLFQYALFRHSMKPSSLLNLPRKELIMLLKANENFIEIIKNLKSSRNINELNLDWSNLTSVADFIIDKREEIKAHFSFIWRELQGYFHLLQDETYRGFPSYLSDLYEELLEIENEDLGQSVFAIDAVSKINGYPNERLLKRIELATSTDKSSSGLLKNIKSISSILTRFKEKLINNPDCEKLLKAELINDLRKQLCNLKNPKTLPLIEVVYFDDCGSVRKGTLPNTRMDARNNFGDNTSYFGVLHDIIKECPEENRILDLFNDFIAKVEELKDSTPDYGNSSRETSNRNLARKNRPNLIKNQVDEGVLKAIFMDLILCMEQQGLIKRDTRKSKAGFIRRLVWL